MDLSSCPQKLEIATFMVAHRALIFPPAFLIRSQTPQWYPVFVVLLAVQKLHIETDRGKISWASLILACVNFQLGDFAASYNTAIFVCMCV